ncbi:hypothetical protein MKEN_01066500 [Mycena kentingensis (nom. inval.)]|nr:hypothetical protein MKEN_01066500 [Mycena kentingensis (nom. inval.)]
MSSAVSTLGSEPVLLESDALYVSTTQLSEATYHWALILTDANCIATRHHWHEQRPRRAEAIEGYGRQTIQPKSLTGRVVLGYFKISHFSAPPPGVFEQICEGTFETSYTTVVDNRQHGITCRTFVLNVLAELCARGYVGGWRESGKSIQGFVDNLEQTIKIASNQMDSAYLTRFLSHRILTWSSSVVVV